MGDVSMKITFYFADGRSLETDMIEDRGDLLADLRGCFTQKSLYQIETEDGVIQMINLDAVDYVEIE